MKTKITIFLLILIVSLSSLSENTLKNFFNINLFSKNSTDEKTFYYPNGQLKSKQFFIKGKKSGVWEYFYENGILKSTVSFIPTFSNKEIGSIINYDKNGLILSDGEFVNGVMTSLWNYYDEKGKKVYSLNHNTGDIVVFNDEEEPIFNISEKELAIRMKEIQKEIKNDKIKSTKERDK